MMHGSESHLGDFARNAGGRQRPGQGCQILNPESALLALAALIVHASLLEERKGLLHRVQQSETNAASDL